LSDHPRVSVRAIAPLVAAVALLCWWWLADDSVPPPVNEEVLAEEKVLPKPVLDQVDVVRDTMSGAAEVVVDYGDEPAEANLDHPYEFSLLVSLMGPFGLPMDGGRVFLSPDLAGFSEWPVQSFAGKVSLNWRGRIRIMQVQVAVMVYGILQPMRSVIIEADTDARVAFAVVGRHDTFAGVRQKLARGLSKDSVKAYEKIKQAQLLRRRFDQLDIECGRTMVTFKMHRCTQCHEASYVSSYHSVARSGTMTPGLHKQSFFEDLRRSRMHGDAGEQKLAAAEKANKLRKAAENRLAATYRAQLTGRVIASDGRGKRGITVAWISEAGEVLQTTMTRGSGEYYLGPVAGGEQRIVVAGGAFGMADQTVRIAPTGNTVANFELTTNQFVVGKLLDESGQPLSDWRVELVRDAGGWSTITATDTTGTFAVYGVPGAVECLVWPKGKDSVFPVIYGVEALVDASVIELKLRADHPIRGRLRARVSLPEGHDAARVDARATQLETGRVTQMKPFGFANEFMAEPLAPGMYRVQMGSPGLAWGSREVHVDGRGLWDVGGIHLAIPGRVRIVQIPGSPDLMQYPHAFYRRTRAVDVRVDYDVEDDVLLLAPGKHVLVWQATGELRSREFEVVSGVEVDLLIWPE
jgi:hypothetical protein